MMKDNRTYSDRREYLIKTVAKRRKKLKQMAVEALGSSCVICGYCRDVSALDFHHIDPKTKSFGISDSGITRSWSQIEAELKKCVLVCANCHREIESGFTILSQEHLQSVK